MSEVSPLNLSAESALDAPLTSPDMAYANEIMDRINSYNPLAPEAEHLRPHQVEAVQQFLQTTADILKGTRPNLGMCILHPTGSGKTVTAAEIIRTVGWNSLMLVPGYQVLNHTTGNSEDIGAIRTFVPELSVGEYSGKNKNTDAQLTVMTYQALAGAIDRGDIGSINPALIICDEVHHVIDGKWAEDVKAISQGRLLLGLTATPAYTDSRDVRRLFPNVLDQKSLKQGIEEGVLSEMRGFLYQGFSKLVVGRANGRRDYSDEEIFSAVANSKDNYLAAAICAGEVAQGRRGIVSCAPGFDRAHAKIMAKILSKTPVKSPDGNRYIRSAYVDGETHPDTLQELFQKYKDGQIDVLTYIDLLREGWDSPETQFGVMLRPTRSRVLAEQRIGRIVRPFFDKVATIHEIVYEIVGNQDRQQTHVDILNSTEEFIQGASYGKRSINKPHLPRHYNSIKMNIFDADKFALDSGLLAAIPNIDLASKTLGDIDVEAGGQAIPYSWSTLHILASKFNVNRLEIEKIISANDVESRTLTLGGVEHTYYAPHVSKLIAEQLGIEELPQTIERPMTLRELTHYVHENSYAVKMRPETIRKCLENAGVEPSLYITPSNQVISAYPFSARDIPLNGIGFRSQVKFSNETHISAPQQKIVNWLAKILVSPKDAPTPQLRKEIITGQSCLLSVIKEKPEENPEDYETLGIELTMLGIEPSPQMKNVMKAKSLSFVELVLLARRAQIKVDRIIMPTSGYRKAA